ncbi:hypothetical protein [Lacipirellula parvula]|uniref:Uncharacterized protein n=1 Tax=Lacipirellula parvula TaxID=2650471 RepID=A0A5K7X9U0_9BACT|nr:hypothetical protein [Lacipirellula parvula]BBO33155.1 hypothetical protein PLANPX_2767 [Lacipirellula parvula]
MKTIRRLIQISNFDGVATTLESVKRGAWIGLQWAHLIGVLACGVIPSGVLAFCLAMTAYRGSLSRLGENGVPWELIGGILFMYALVCGWGALFGAVLGPICYVFTRRRWVNSDAE